MPCPDVQTIRQVLTGQAGERDLIEIEQHLSECPDCPAVFERALGETVPPMLRMRPEPMPDNPEDRLPGGVFQDFASYCWGADLKALRVAEGENLLGRLGRYTLTRVLGVGGMGVVMEGVDEADGSRVALKTLRHARVASRGTVDRFTRETRIMQGLGCPGVVPVLETGQDDGLPWFTMPLLEGRNLADHLRLHGPLPLGECVELARQAAETLAAAHAVGVLHRDIKPQNLWVEQDAGGKKRLLVLDFGLAGSVSTEGMSTATGTVLGTLAYLPPERARSNPPEADARGDLFSLGCVFYEMVTGRRVVTGDSPFDQAGQLHNLRVKPAGDVRPGGVPPRLERVIMGLLAVDPARRTADAATLLRQLQDPDLLAVPLVSRRLILRAGAGLAAGGLFGGAAWWLTRPKGIPAVAPDLVVEVPGAVTAAVAGAVDDIPLVLWADDTGALFCSMGYSEVPKFGNTSFEISKIYLNQDGTRVMACGNKGQLQLFSGDRGRWMPREEAATASGTLEHGFFPIQIAGLSSRFYAVEENRVSVFDTNDKLKAGSKGPDLGSRIVNAVSHPSISMVLLIATQSGMIERMDMTKIIFGVRSLILTEEVPVASGPIRIAVSYDGSEVACLNEFGKLSMRAGATLSREVRSCRAGSPVPAGDTVDMFYLGMSRNLVVLKRNGDQNSAWVIDSMTGKVKERLLATNPLQAGLIDGKVWLLDSDQRWKRYPTV